MGARYPPSRSCTPIDEDAPGARRAAREPRCPRNIRDVEDNVRGGMLDAGTWYLRSGFNSWRRLPTLLWPPHASSPPPVTRGVADATVAVLCERPVR